MSEPDEGPWDPATEHDEQAALDGDDQATIVNPNALPSALAQRARARAARQQVPQTTLPPPGVERLPAKPAPAASPAPANAAPLAASSPTSPHEHITPVALAAVTEAHVRASRGDDRITPPAALPVSAAVGADEPVVVLDKVSAKHAATPAPRTDAAAGGHVIVATGADGERARKLCHAHGLLVPIMSSLSIVHDAVSVIVIGEPSPPAPERVVHVARPTMSDDALIALLRALLGARVLVDPLAVSPNAEPRVLDFASRIATLDDRGAIEMIAIEAITAVTSADRAHLLFHDPLSGLLWSEARRRAKGDDRRAITGIAGWCAQTGMPVHASPAGDDPRYFTDIDDPDGKPQSRLIVQPVIGADRRVHAVLVAARRWRRSDFSEQDRANLKNLAALIAPTIDIAAAAAGSEPRRPRSTLPGVTASKSGDTAAASPHGTSTHAPSTHAPPTHATQSAIVGSPRKPADSRPPPVTARRADSKPPPVAAATPATPANAAHASAPATATRATTAPATATAATTTATTTPPTTATPATAMPATATPATATPATATPATATPATTTPATATPSSATPATAASTTAASTATAAATATSKPSPPTGPREASFTPASGQFAVTGGPAAAPGKRPPTDPPPARPDSVNRSRSASDQPRSKRPSGGDATEPRDIAVVASNEDDIARVKRLAKKARLEISVLNRIEDVPPYYRVVTIGEAWTPDTDNRVAYAARSTITDDHLIELLAGLATDRAPTPLVATKPQSAADAKRTQLAFERSRKLATARDLVEGEAVAVAAVRELVDADRAYCLYFDSEDGALWSEARERERRDDRRAIAGVVGWAARTGRAVNVPRASADPRWLGPLDDPDGDPNSQLLIQPIVAGDRSVVGVLVAVRRPKRPGFSDLDATILARFAALAAPLLAQLELAVEAQHMLHADGARDGSDADDLRAVESPLQSLLRRAQSLPRWSYAAAGAGLMLVIVLIASC